MKLSQLKTKLEQKDLKNVREIRKEFKHTKKIALYSKSTKSSLDSMKIIGITGSCGKSTTAYIVHEYLKSLGYKSVLYSSTTVDSPASHIMKNESFETAVKSEDSLLGIINEAEAYGAEYLVLEINETVLEKGLVKDVPFDVRVLTNLNPKHNEEQYSAEEYIAIKKSFFENLPSDKECKCVIGIQDNFRRLFEEMLELNDCEKLVFSSNYIANVNGLNPNDITCLLYDLDSTLDGLKMKVLANGVSYELETKVMMAYNAFNFVGAMTVLEALGVLNVDKFKKCIKDIKIPGRVETYKVNGRLIVIDNHLPKLLECLQSFKDRCLIKKIRVVVGSMGTGFKYWDERFKTSLFVSKRREMRKYAMDLLKDYADYVYLTEDDNAAESVESICQELQGYLNNEVPSTIVPDRSKAIKKAMEESEVNDVIFISGRGNRRKLCDSSTTIKFVKDAEVVEKVIIDLGW